DFSGRLTTISAVVDHRHSRHDATIPEDHNGPAVLPLFCLAPHGVFPAARITPRAVSSYLAFSPLPALLSKNRRYLFCDTFRRRSFSTAPPAFSTRHAAVWCSDFPLASLKTHQRSSAIAANLPRSTRKEREPRISKGAPPQPKGTTADDAGFERSRGNRRWSAEVVDILNPGGIREISRW